MVFIQSKDLKKRARMYENEEDDDNAFREMNEYEDDLMRKFQEND